MQSNGRDLPLANESVATLDKTAWRGILKDRLNFSEDLKGSESEKICINLKLLLAKAKGPVGAFAGLSEEPNLKALVSGLNLDWCFPKVSGEILEFYRASWTDLQPGHFGVLEPKAEPSNRVAVSELGWCLVPALGYDRKGVRIGRGKGFYDKSLVSFKGSLVGVAFSQAVVTENLPSKSHDVRMNWVVTDQYLLKVSY